MNSLESVRTYEGTDEVHILVLGNAITGIPAFRQTLAEGRIGSLERLGTTLLDEALYLLGVLFGLYFALQATSGPRVGGLTARDGAAGGVTPAALLGLGCVSRRS